MLSRTARINTRAAVSLYPAIVTGYTNSNQTYYFHPILLDGAMQSMVLLNQNNADNSTYVPYAFTRMTVFQETPSSIWVHLTRHEGQGSNDLCLNIHLYDNSGLLLGRIEGLKFRKVTRRHFISYEPGLHHLYQRTWCPLKTTQPMNQALPKLSVIAQNKEKAEKLLTNVHFEWAETNSSVGDITGKHLVFIYEQGQFDALFQVCQMLFKAKPKSFILVTQQAYASFPKAKTNPYQSMASAFWSSFSSELEFNNNYTVDLDEFSELIPALHYFFNVPSAEKQLIMRESLHVPRLKKIHPHSPTVPLETLYKDNATYLITGGTGGLAKPLIEYLISRGAKHFALVSRTAPDSDTNNWLNSVRHQQIDIKHYAADAAQYQQMEQVINGIELGEYSLKGVFHLAGVIHDGLIVNLNAEGNQQVLRSKVDSALILHQLTQNIRLDHFILFSSVASLLGPAGQSNYAAANGFLDGLAHLRHHQGLPALSINWGPFNSLGMTATLTQGLQTHGFILLEKASLELLDLLVSSPLTQVAPCPMRWEVYSEHAPKQGLLSDLIQPAPFADHYYLQSLRQQDKAQRLSTLSQTLCEITSSVLGLEGLRQVKTTDSLFELGLDSLMAIEIRNKIQDKLQCPALNLSIEYFINDPSVIKIARYIAYELKSIFAEAPEIHTVAIQENEEIAVCDFQYVFWLMNQFSNSFNLGFHLKLHGKVNKEYVDQAFEYVVKQNSAFWLRFNSTMPTQRVIRDGQFKLIYKDISLENDFPMEREAYRNMFRLIPLNEQPLIRVYLYKINPDLHELHVLIPHIIADDRSCAIVLHQFKTNYEALVNGNDLFLLPEKSTYLNYVKQNNIQYEQNIVEKINFWQHYNKDSRLLNFGKKYHLADTFNQPKHLYHYPLASDQVEQFIDWHQRNNMNVSSGLFAISQLVFYKMTGENKIPVILIHSGREGSQYKHIIGLFSEYKRINLVLDKNNRFIDCVNNIEKQLMITAPFQKCSHFIKNKGLKGSRIALGQSMINRFNTRILTKPFQKSQLNKRIIECYIAHYSRIEYLRKRISFRQQLNQLLNRQGPVEKPEGLRILLSVTPSFFTKAREDMTIADLNYTIPNHFGCMDRPISNNTLWIYFSKNHFGEYQLSINGPLTQPCKDKIALNFTKIVDSFLSNKDDPVAQLILDKIPI